MLSAEVDNVLLGRGWCVGAQHHKGTRGLAPLFVGSGNDRCILDGGMAVQRIFDLNGGNVLSTGDDDVLGSVLELDVAILVYNTEIAGVKPTSR